MMLVVASLNVQCFNKALIENSGFKPLNPKPSLAQMQEDIGCLHKSGIPGEEEYRQFKSCWRWGASFWSGSNENRSAGVAMLIRSSTIKVVKVEEVIHG